MVGKFESNKDLVQELTSTGAKRVGAIATLITNVVADVAKEIGEFATDVIEMREAARAAQRDRAAAARVDEGRAHPDVLIDEPQPHPAADAVQPFIDVTIEEQDSGR
ncbi:hypothetical protein [Nocardia stercoris]|uniref:Uncharacterized protein n=1 Tax=Nocardia stercoris TaxID=2483361 RepID=A0A3M2L563_9NOCA|nr:hypothetical protein [Nocardia stercoris]RMI32731.1 hypothetical protein EBN03_12290 [Nocardia stercoris]